MAKKYELTSENRVLSDGTVVYRIRAVNTIRRAGKIIALPGDFGGYVQSAKNLSQENSCWVDHNAVVYGNASVSGSAEVSGCACVSGNAVVKDFALVCGNTLVTDNAVIKDNACVYDLAVVRENATVSSSAIVEGNSVISGSAIITTLARVSAVVTGKTYVGGKSVIKKSVISDNSCITGSIVIKNSTIKDEVRINSDFGTIINCTFSEKVNILNGGFSFKNCSIEGNTYIGHNIYKGAFHTRGCIPIKDAAIKKTDDLLVIPLTTPENLNFLLPSRSILVSYRTDSQVAGLVWHCIGFDGSGGVKKDIQGSLISVLQYFSDFLEVRISGDSFLETVLLEFGKITTSKLWKFLSTLEDKIKSLGFTDCACFSWKNIDYVASIVISVLYWATDVISEKEDLNKIFSCSDERFKYIVSSFFDASSVDLNTGKLIECNDIFFLNSDILEDSLKTPTPEIIEKIEKELTSLDSCIYVPVAYKK